MSFVEDLYSEELEIDPVGYGTVKQMQSVADSSLGHWIQLQDGRTVIHLETDLPILRVFDPKAKRTDCINIREVIAIFDLVSK